MAKFSTEFVHLRGVLEWQNRTYGGGNKPARFFFTCGNNLKEAKFRGKTADLTTLLMMP